MNDGRLSSRNAAIAAMLADGEQLKNFYRFIAQNPHINLHDACQIIIERPNATVCYSFNEWAAMDRRITKGRKGIAYYDIDGYKQFVFDANDTHGDTRYSRPILPMKQLLEGLDELNGTEIADSEQSDYRKIQNGVRSYLAEQRELTDDGERERLLIEGITYSLYSKTGFPKSAGIKLSELPYSYSENAALVKEIYIQTNMLAQDIEDAYRNKQSEITVIDDTEEETISDEPIVSVEQSEQPIEEHSEAKEPKHPMYPLYKRYMELQNEKPDAIVLMRLGDFYEVWDEKSKELSDELNLTLTGRDVGLSERMPMCGIPQHSLGEFLDKIRELHGVLLVEDFNAEPKYIFSYAEEFEQREKEEAKLNPQLTEITDDEPSLFDDEQSDTDEDWRNELAAELGEMDDEQSDEEANEFDDSEEMDEGDSDSSSDEQDEEEETKKPKDKSTQKKPEKGIKERKRKEKAQPTLFDLTEPQEKSHEEKFIENELLRGSHVVHGKFRIFDKYNENLSVKAFAEFLKKEYGIGGYYLDNANGNYDAKGISLKWIDKEHPENNLEIKLKWPEVATRIADLIDDEIYFDEKEKKEYAEYKVEQNRQRAIRQKENEERAAFLEKVFTSAPQERKERIQAIYDTAQDINAFTDAVRSLHGYETRDEIDGFSVLYNPVGVFISKFDDNGVKIDGYTVSWEETAGFLTSLIKDNKYLTPLPSSELKADDYENGQDEKETTEAKPFNRFKELTPEGRAFFESYQQSSMREPTMSPWDQVQTCRTIANGIYEVSTAGHGGIMISNELAPYILSPEALAVGFSEKGYYCYEEDCDASVPLRELWDKGILNQTHEYFTHYYVNSYRPEADNGCVPFNEATETEKVEHFKWWNNAINESLEDWNEEYWKAHEQIEAHEEKTSGENTDLTGVLDQSELGGAKTRFRNNVAAIKLVNKLYSENRNPTEAEKKVLSQFVGWGGLSQAFDENNPQWAKEYSELKGLLSQEDYEQARGSTLNAYYTAKDVIGGIYVALNRFGVKGNNRILEPSMGTGNFFGYMPKEISEGAKLYGVELDNLTGRIAAKLYPQANVQIKGFEDTTFPNDKFDIVVGNVPFGGYGVADSDYNKYNFKVHDYFLAKSIDKVKPNGIVAIITSKGTMDKLNPSARKYVAERAELLGAIRLPNTAFKQTAGTEAVADILFFRKRAEKTADISNEEWLGTGTPISNSMAEMYTMQSYLQPAVLKESGIDFFDGWAANFGETITSMELAPSGQGYKARTRFAKFTNLPELLTMYRSFADVQTADMVKLNVPEAKRHVMNLKPSDTVIELAESIADRAEKIHGGSVPPEEDNMLKVTSDGKKLALDPRCFDPMSEDENGSKINEAAKNIYGIWEETAEKKGTQIVFCDLSTPKRRFEEYNYGINFDAYNDLKHKLVQQGIPADEIAFIHDANTDEQKQALFDKVNSGAVRVLIGSTEKCGAGTNVQKRLVALHHLDTPYRPSDMEQREGRIIRQGNTNEKVDIYTYVTERTFDSYSYQILENKQKFIAQINRGDLTVREAEDIDETTLNYAEIKAITAANPRIKRKMEVDTEIARLRVLEGQYRKNLYDLQDKIRKTFPEDIRKQELLVERVTLDLMHLESRKPTDPEAFEISVNGKVYTDRKEGGKALTDALYASKPDTVVAEYCGFKISMNPMNSLTGEREITLSANGQYTAKIGESSSGNLVRLDNFVEDFPRRKARLENTLASLKNDLEIAKEQVEKPFEHKEYLADLLKEQSELNAELNLDKREESVIIDDGNDSDDEGNYRMLPTQKDMREVNIIDEEDKVASMKVEVLPDYTITQEDMHEYGYKWDGMLPLDRAMAVRLWGMGLGVCKLGKDDDHTEVDDYRDFNDDNAIYGIEKPVWDTFLHQEKSLPYFMARLQIAEAAKQVTSRDLDCVDERFTIGFIETNYAERTSLEKYLADKTKSEVKELKAYIPQLLDEFSQRIWRDELKFYGWTKEDVPKSIAAHIVDEELKAYAKKVASYSFDAQAELMNILDRFTDEEIDEMNLPAFDDELTVVAKEPTIYLNEEGKTYLPGVLMLRNEITGDYYVINDTSAKGKDGNELEIGDTTDVETVLAYNGMSDGNPLREFHDDREARRYFDERVNAIHSVKVNSEKYREAVVNSVLLEYDKLQKKMLNSSPQEVLNNHYKIHCFERLSSAIEEDTEYLSDDEYKALYKERGNILNNIYEQYIIPDVEESNNPTNLDSYDDIVRCIQSYCMENHSVIYNNKPVYLNSLEYAQTHDELEKYHDSRNMSLRCKSAISKGISNNFDGMRLNSGFEDEIIKEYGMERVAYLLATTIKENETDGRFSRSNKDWANTIPISESEDERRICCLNVHHAVLDSFTNIIRKKMKEEEKTELAQDKYLHFTARGDKVLSIVKDRDDRNIAIIQREKIGDYVVAAGYDTTDGTWRAGKYDLPTLETAEQYRTEKYGFENMSDTTEKKWLTCKISPEALIKKYQFNSRFRMPQGSGYEGYAYSIFNDRIKEGTITTDLKSDTRERALVLHIPTNAKVEISGNGKTVELDPHDFISLVNETTSDKYEREQRYIAVFPPEAIIKEYDTSMLMAMPNDSKYKGYVYYMPSSVVSENTNKDDGSLIANIGESFKVTLRKGEEKVEITAKEYSELVGGKKADKYKREPSELDEYREQQGGDDKKWNTVAISENAVIANYKDTTLFKMPKGEYAGCVYYIPSGMVKKEDDGLYLRMPEDFEVHLKGGEEKKDLTAQEFIAAIKGKTDEDYESIYRRPSEEARKQFEKVEQQLRKNVPEEMRNKPNWVVVRTRKNVETGRLDKFLIDTHTGKFAESDNPETWADFETACKYARENGGVSLAYALEWDSDIACIDLDGCMDENGDFSEIAQQSFNAANGSYAEKSVSGKGLHIFGKTKGADLRSFSKDKTMEYYQGVHFIAMTGDYYGSSELKSFDTPEMQTVLTSKLEKRTEWTNTGKGVEGLSSMDDREMLDRAFAAKNGDTVKRLYRGEDIRGNHSNSDMSLMNYLAFWSNHDIDQMLRVFATSGLYRADKPQSYYEHTAIKAVKGTPCYTPPKASNSAPKSSGSGNSKA